MRITTKTAPAVEPISLNDAKLHLRLATTATEATAYTTEDALLTRLITVARIQAENELGRALITQTKEYYLDDWPDGDEIVVPYPNLQTATVTYRLEDDTGYDNTLSTVDTDTDSEPGRLVLQPDEEWPDETLYTDRPIKIEFDCGYGDDADDVPEAIKQGMLLKITDLYEHRGQIVLGVAVNRINNAVDSLFASYRIHTRF